MPNPTTPPPTLQPNPTAAKAAPTPSPSQVAPTKPSTPPNATPTSVKSPSKPSRPPFRLPLSLTTITSILLLILITQISLLGILGKTLKTQITQSEIVSRQIKDQQQAVTSLSQYQDQINQLTKSFPKESGIIEFVQFARERSANLSKLDVQISNNEPIQTAQSAVPFLPVSITATATPSAFTKLVNDISHSPYLFQPVLLEINAQAGLSNEATLKYFGNLYVSPELVKK